MKKRNVLYFLVFLLLAKAGFVLAEPETLFFKANQAYENEAYDEAIALYHQIEDEGFASGNLYYNLGNAYFKTDQLGEALLYYRKAENRIPFDEDLFANKTLIEKKLGVKPLDEDHSTFVRVISKVRDLFTLPVWGLMLTIFWTIFILLLNLSFFFELFKKRRKRIIIWSALIIFHISLFFGLKLHHSLTFQTGIITDPNVLVRYSPDIRGAEAFRIDEGMEVQVLRSQKEWSLIRVEKGKSGWIQSNQIGVI